MARADVTNARSSERLVALELPQSTAAWMQSARKEAFARVSDCGLPIKRDEYWRFTNPVALTQKAAPEAKVSAEKTGPFAALDAFLLVFVDGVFDADRSGDLTKLKGAVTLLADAAQDETHWAADLYGKLEADGQQPVQRPLASLNTAMSEQGIMLHVQGTMVQPLHIIYETTAGKAVDVSLHHVVKLEEGASATLLESGYLGTRGSQVLEVQVAANAHFNHIRFQGSDDAQVQATHCFAELDAEASFKSFTLTFDGALTRNECVVTLNGDDAAAHVSGACLGNGRGFHHDDTVFVTHDAQNCESRQVFKKVLRNGATGVFQGKILVKADAQKTDGYQISQSLLLDDDSQFLAKPELEIYADDVACSHGSTSGAIDETALFYLRSRGVSEREAKTLLTLAFLAEALEEIESEELTELLTGYIGAELGLEG